MIKIAIAIAVIFASATAYVVVKNRHMPHLTIRQKVLRAFYPLIMKMGKSKNDVIENVEQKDPDVACSDVSVAMPDSTILDLKQYSGKKIIVVNTASDCGYTAQYESLERLYELYRDKLIIIAIPSNDFMNQEKGNDQEIASFCNRNFNVSFPLAQKGVVVKQKDQIPIYQWLTDPKKNGWNAIAPKWNFCKYIIDENGRLTHFLNSTVDPMGKEMREVLGLAEGNGE